MTQPIPSETIEYERYVDGLRKSNRDLLAALRNLYDACGFWEDQDDPVLAEARNAIAAATGIALLTESANTIAVQIEGGLVQDVAGIPAGYEVRVEDRDDGDTSHPSWDAEKGCFVTVYEGDANG